MYAGSGNWGELEIISIYSLLSTVTFITQVVITQGHKYETEHNVFNKISAEADEAYGGLLQSGSASAGLFKLSGNSSLTKKGSNLKISFKVRKVLIQRPWFQPNLMQYPALGIRGMTKGSWSTGQLDFQENKGIFPILPTAFVVARDVEISADSYSDIAESSFLELHADDSVKVSKRVYISHVSSIPLFSLLFALYLLQSHC